MPPLNSKAVLEAAPNKHPTRVWGVLAAIFIVGLLIILSRLRLPGRLSEQSSSWISKELTSNDSESPVSAAVLSPDGSLMAYTDPEGVFVRQMKTGKTRLFKGPAVHASRLTWFPDQTHLVLTGFNVEAEQTEIWIVSANREDSRLFRRNADEGVPSPDGRSLAFTVDHGQEIRLANTAGGEERTVARGKADERFSPLFWAAGGTRISYQRRITSSQPGTIQIESNYQWAYVHVIFDQDARPRLLLM